MIGRIKFNDKHFQLQSPAGRLITQSAHVYLDLIPYLKRMLTEIYAGNQYLIIQ
jgi:hypothetical protein